MSDETNRDLDDVLDAESTRGRARPVRISARERNRRFVAAARMLKDSNATLRQYLEAIRAIEPDERSAEFQKAVELWYDYRGKS